MFVSGPRVLKQIEERRMYVALVPGTYVGFEHCTHPFTHIFQIFPQLLSRSKTIPPTGHVCFLASECLKSLKISICSLSSPVYMSALVPPSLCLNIPKYFLTLDPYKLCLFSGLWVLKIRNKEQHVLCSAPERLLALGLT